MSEVSKVNKLGKIFAGLSSDQRNFCATFAEAKMPVST